jgi:hypothetical protein
MLAQAAGRALIQRVNKQFWSIKDRIVHRRPHRGGDRYRIKVS